MIILTRNAMVRATIVAVLLTVSPLIWHIVGLLRVAPVAPRLCQVCSACPVPTLLDNAIMAARHEVWAWFRWNGDNGWTRDDRLRITCSPVRSDGWALCSVSGPGRPGALLTCDARAYPFNEGCVWLDDDLHRRHWQ